MEDVYLGAGGRMRRPLSESRELQNITIKLVALKSRHPAITEDVDRILRDVRRLQMQVADGFHRNPPHAHNPPLVIFGNPPMGKVRRGAHRFEAGKIVGQLSDEAHAILYRHIEDGKPYRHDFETPVGIFAIERAGHRDILLTTSPEFTPIWEDFD